MVFKHDMHIYVYNCNQLRKISLNHDDIQTYKHAFISVCVRMCVPTNDAHCTCRQKLISNISFSYVSIFLSPSTPNVFKHKYENKRRKMRLDRKCMSGPIEIALHHMVKLCIKWPIKVSKSFQNSWINSRMRSAFCLAKAMRVSAAFSFFQTRKPFRLVKIKMFL